jgi:TonB family protein
LVWIALRQLTVEAERACDDAVLGRSEATAYADQLVGLAQRLSGKSPVLAMANRADLATRVGAVLDRRQRRGRAGVFPVALACAAAAVLVLTISPLRMVAAPQAVAADVRTNFAPALALTVAPVKLLAAPQAASTAARPTPVPRFRSTTALVAVNVMVTVTDANGVTIEGLRAEDFTVSEDGVAQTISFFEFQKVVDSAKAAELPSSYYSLGYYPRNTDESGAFRRIKVGLKETTGATLRFRTGYYPNRVFDSAAPSVVDNGPPVDPSAPVLIRKVEPEYSEEARKTKWQGTSTLSVDIDESGRVTAAYVIRALGLGLDEKAVQAVRQWQFKPATKDGKPVAVRAEVEMIFRLL